MNRIKDFFYNRSDIIIVLIILFAAGLLIYSRLHVIMDYPQKFTEENKVQTEEAVDESTAE